MRSVGLFELFRTSTLLFIKLSINFGNLWAFSFSKFLFKELSSSSSSLEPRVTEARVRISRVTKYGELWATRIISVSRRGLSFRFNFAGFNRGTGRVGICRLSSHRSGGMLNYHRQIYLTATQFETPKLTVGKISLV